MKPIIVDMKNMSDSTEVYESRPNPFFAYFIYLILGLLVIAICWMYFSKIDIVVKGNGVFKTNDEIYIVSSSTTGKVDDCNITDGQFVNTGDVLFTVSTVSIEESKEIYNATLEELNLRITMLEAYQKCMDGNNEDFDSLYDNKFYEEFYNRKKLLEASINSSDKNIEGQKAQYQKNIDDISNSITEYEKQITKIDEAKQCVKSRINAIEASDTYYNSIVNSYISNYNMTELQYDNSIKIASDNIETLRAEKEKTLANLELQQLSNLEQQIQTINTTIISLKSNITSLKVQMEALDSNSSDTAKNIANMTEKNNVNTELLTYNSKKTECESNVKMLESKINNCFIIANANGYVSLSQDIKKGSYVQEGTNMCQIIPENSQGYYAEIYVENADVAKLKVDQNVKFEIAAYPSNEYGNFMGIINTIAKDIKVDSNSGAAYYLVKVKCDGSTVTNKDGKTGSLMNGMACQSKVIVDKQRVLFYLLEKIDLLD